MKIYLTLKTKEILQCLRRKEIAENENTFIPLYINQWLTNKHKKAYIVKDDANNITCFAILHKMDFDPNHQFKKPYLLDLIYTFKEYRRNGFATRILTRIKENGEEITAFCSNDCSAQLFARNGFTKDPFQDPYGNDLYRSPV